MQSAMTQYNRVHKTTTHLALALKFPLALGIRAGLALLTLLVLLATGRVAAQSGAGSIQGTVEDATGAIIPGGKVDIVNVAKGTAIHSVANGTGFYSVPGLFAGDYKVTFSASGMKQYEVTISLQDAQNAVINPQLAVGATTEKITVSADEIQLATYDSGTIATEIDRNRIDQLPMNTRIVLNLAADTVPGLEAGGTRANGNMAEGLEYTQDGAPMTNRNFGGETNSTQAQLPDPDAVQEVKIETVTSNAQFATPATAIITTKSGTNTLHGSLFETARNNAVGNAVPRGTIRASYLLPHLVRNEFGASGGGPIRIPHVYNGTDKSFFFVAYERFSLGQSTPENAFVPTVAMRGGDFSKVDPGGVVQQLYDPNTTGNAASNYQRTAFVNNQIPLTRISPLAKNLYAATPLPNVPGNPDPFNTSNIQIPNVTQTVIPNITFRLDHVVNQSNRLFLRFTDINQTNFALRNYPSNTSPTLATNLLPAKIEGYQTIPVNTISASLGFTHVFSPTFTSETIYAQQWFRQYVAGTTLQVNVESALGLPNNFGETGFPTIGGNGFNLLMPYGGTQYNYGENQIEFNLDENLTKIVGKHQVQFGIRYRRERIAYLPDRSSDAVNFSNLATADMNASTGAQTAACPTCSGTYTANANTGDQEADFFLGAASKYSLALSPTLQHFTDYEMDSYVQDNYHVSSRLTLNLGLRWEAHPSPITRDSTLAGFDLAHDAVVLANPLSTYIAKGYTTQAIVTSYANVGVNFETPQAAGIPSTMIYNQNAEFNPRVGVAYEPFSKNKGTVIRGAYGRYIYPIPIRNSLKTPANAPPFSATYFQDYTLASQSPDSLPNYLLRSAQTVIAGSNSTGVVNSSTTNAIGAGFSFQTLDPHYPPAAVTQANVTIEQPIKGGSVLRATYLLDHGSNLDQNFQYNNHPSQYVYETVNGIAPPGGIGAVGIGPYDHTTYGGNTQSVKTGWSNDNALQLNYQRPFKGGYAYQVFYVYSRAFRVGGNTFRDSSLYPVENFIPGTIAGINPGTPTSPSHALNRLENYKLDTAIPEHHVSFNGIVDLPVGKGKRLLGNSNKFVDELLGGYQVAFVGNVVSQSFSPASSNWGATNPIQVYKNGAPITDCRSGTCLKEKLWFNGFIVPSKLTAVTGLPSGYLPYLSPINVAANNNNVNIPLSNGTVDTNTAYSPGPAGVNRFSNTVLLGPYNYNVDMSLYKVFPIKDQMNLRINVDAFNAFNIQGNVNPNTTDGTENITQGGGGYWTPRQIQLTARFSF